MERIVIKDKQFEPYIKADKLQETVKGLAERINEELKHQEPLFLAVLNGSFMFASDLLKEININCRISFIKLASYHGTSSSGLVHELIGLTEEVKGKTVVVIEDIVDSGLTLEKVHRLLENKGAANIFTATLLFKPGAYKKEMPLDFVGIEIPNDFVVGYGLDYDGLGRNLKDIYVHRP